MKERILRAVSVIITVGLILSLFVGCGNTQTAKEDGSTTQVATTQEVTTQEPAMQEPATLKILFLPAWSGYEADNFSVHYIEEKTNTKWELIVMQEADQDQKLSVLMASGDGPDIFNFTELKTYEEFSNSDALLPINEYFDKAPNLFKSREGEIWNVVTHPDGNIYYIPIKTVKGNMITQYRKDWLDKFNLQVPKTLDEYFHVADVFSNNDPDGNSKKDTYAFGGPKWMNLLEHIFSAYGIPQERWMEKDGQLVYSMIQPEAKEVIKFLNKLYKAGAIDPEFITDSEDRTFEKWSKGVYGAMYWYNFVFDTNNLYNFYDTFKTNNPNAEWVEGGILQGPGKTYGVRSLPLAGWVKTGVYKNSKNVDAAIRVLDWLATDEGVMFCNYGLKGEHYDISQDGVVTVKWNDEQKKKLGITSTILAADQLIKTTSAQYQRISQMSCDISQSDIIEGWILPADYQRKSVGRDDALRAMFAKMITGDAPIDATFEEYVKYWKENDGDVETEVYNKLYQERKNK